MPRDLLAYLVAALALGGTKCVYDRGQRQAGALEERLRVADSLAVVQSARIAHADTVYVRDTVRLTRSVTRWRDSVVARVDTLSDTVRVPVEIVREVVREADSTIRVCQSVVLSCEARVAARDSLVTTLRSQVALVRRQQPGLLKRWSERLVWVAAGALLADVLR